MKKLIILAVIGFGAWNHFMPQLAGVGGVVDPGHSPAGADPVTRTGAGQSTRFRCDGRQYCTQMSSRAEAVFFINNCPNTKMDGDHDGRPCENDSRF